LLMNVWGGTVAVALSPVAGLRVKGTACSQSEPARYLLLPVSREPHAAAPSACMPWLLWMAYSLLLAVPAIGCLPPRVPQAGQPLPVLTDAARLQWLVPARALGLGRPLLLTLAISLSGKGLGRGHWLLPLQG